MHLKITLALGAATLALAGCQSKQEQTNEAVIESQNAAAAAADASAAANAAAVAV